MASSGKDQIIVSDASTSAHSYYPLTPSSSPPPSLADPIYGRLPLHNHLRETRVVYLEKGTWDDTISCRLEVVALGIKPEYEAVSYVWGTAYDDVVILLNGHEFSVGETLASCLRHVRSTTEDKPLWADAICINQRDLEERNEQVALMRDIYSQCRGVIIWLGEASLSWPHTSPPTKPVKPSVSPIQWMTSFTTHTESPRIRVHPDDSARISDFHAEVTHYYKLPFALRQSLQIDTLLGAYCLIHQLAQNKHINHHEIPLLANHDAFHRVIRALHHLMSLPWWRRQWVIQEIVLPPAATLYLERFTAPWSMFAAAARNYDHHRTVCCQSHYQNLHGNDIRHLEHFSWTITELDKLREEWQGILAETVVAKAENSTGRSSVGASNPPPPVRKPKRKKRSISLRQLLWQFRKRDSTDPRDKVFALFPMVNDWGKHTAMYPEYRWTPQAVYRAVTEKIISVDESLLVLMGPTEKSTLLADLPSWVPDWTHKLSGLELERLERARLFRACGGRKLEVRFMDEDVLELKGVGFDAVEVVSEEVMRYDDEDETLRIFAAWYNLVSRMGSITDEYVCGKKSRMEAYWRTLCMDTCRSVGFRGARYRRCYEDYVDDCQALWMDGQGLPLPNGSVSNASETNLASVDLYSQSSDGSYLGSTSGSEQDGYEDHLNPHIIPDGPPRPTKDSPGNNKKPLNYVTVDFAITSATVNQRLFFTKKGYMALGPANIRPGDQIYVFAGGHMPFVVRDAGSREMIPFVHGKRNVHHLLGECYVHGIMDGEVTANWEAESRNVYLV
ncbi:hypothetical protein DL546_004382 [Coniochaeta pulveracea]|uniref:Heterokaryon incompatibility domain-containing protein n=1 Tax=Coniochaeta pulveracea TaxID=177199 RepID=A0A420YBY8_9PEZI|nr:hypothetical protein DL546_004382 [Coniochaeta pulveracea]